MKLLLVGNYPPPYGGISTHVQTLVYRLVEEKKYKVQLLDVEVSREQKQDGIVVPSGKISFLQHLVSCTKDVDCVHLHTNGHNIKSWILILLVAVVASFRRTKSIVTLHSGNCPAFVIKMGRLQKFFLLGSLRLYTKVISVNSHSHDLLKGMTGLRDKVERVPAYVGLRCPPKPLEHIGLVTFLQRYPLIFSTIVAFRPEYGLDTLIDFIERWDKKYSDAGLIIIGSGSGQEQISRQVDERGLSEKIYIVKDLPPGDIYTVLKMSAVFIRATAYDGDSISIREALSLGVPVVATNTDFRPPGVVVFEIADAIDLTEKILSVLEPRNTHQDHSIGEELAIDYFSELFEIYNNIGMVR